MFLLSSIMQPSAPKVTITNLSLGNLNSIETSAVATDGAPVHVCTIRQTRLYIYTR